MGLDLVELVVEVERSFGVSIPDQDAAKLETVGEVFDYLRAKADRPLALTCATSSAFYGLRAAIIRDLGVDRSELRPASALEHIFGAATRREDWARVTRALKSPLRPLLPSGGVLATIFLISALAALVITFVTSVLVGALCFVGSLVLLFKVTRRFWRAFPGDSVNLGDLARMYARDNYAVAISTRGWNDGQAWQVLREIIVEQLGVKPDMVTRNARLVQLSQD